MARVICFDCNKRGSDAATAPPAKRRVPGRFERIGFGFFIGCCLFLIFVPLASGPASAALALVLGITTVAWCMYVAYGSAVRDQREAKAWNDEKWPKLHEAWSRTSRCVKCGRVPPTPNHRRLRLLSNDPPGSSAA